MRKSPDQAPPRPQLLPAAEQDQLECARRYERLISTIPCALYDYVRWPDGRNRFCYISPQCEDIFEQTAERIMADASILWGMVHPADLDRLVTEDSIARQTRHSFQSEVRICLRSGRTKWIELTSRPGPDRVEGQDVWSGVILDVTDRKTMEEERNHLLAQLLAAQAEVKTLSGFLPICSGCKKIRDDAGYWTQLEAYISARSEAVFSHGICPECAQKFYVALQDAETANRESTG